MGGLFGCVLALGCASSTKGGSHPAPVGPSGGQVAPTDGAGAMVPPGAVTTDTTITITPSAAAAPSGATAVSGVYNYGPEGTQFAKPVTITLTIDMSKLPPCTHTDDVRVYTSPKGAATYTQLDTTVVDDAHVSAATSHFSDFTAAVPDSASRMSCPDLGMVVADAASPEVTDMTVVSCPPTPNCSQDYSKCGCTGTCGGSTYSLSCYYPSSSPLTCDCKKDGVIVHSFTKLNQTCSLNGELVWFQKDCGFGPP
jgi:hypothetical protein